MKNKPEILKTFVIAAMLSVSFLLNAQQEYKIEVKNVESCKAAVIKAEVESAQIGESMGAAYGKLFGFLGEKKIQPAGSPFAVYYTFDPQGKTQYEAGVPVKSKTEGSGDIQIKEYPAMKVVSVYYKGSYESMMPVYEAIDKYIADNKLEKAGASWEIYLTDPMETAPDQNETIIYFPVK